MSFSLKGTRGIAIWVEMVQSKRTKSKKIGKYTVLMNFRKVEEVPVHDLAKQWGVSFQSVVALISVAMRNHLIYVAVRETGYEDHDVPRWFKRPGGCLDSYRPRPKRAFAPVPLPRAEDVVVPKAEIAVPERLPVRPVSSFTSPVSQKIMVGEDEYIQWYPRTQVFDISHLRPETLRRITRTIPSTREPVLAKDKPSVTWTSEKTLEFLMMLKTRKDIEDFRELERFILFSNYVMNMPYKAVEVQKEVEESGEGYVPPITQTMEQEDPVETVKAVADALDTLVYEPRRRVKYKILEAFVDVIKNRDEEKRESLRRLSELKSRMGKSYREIEREREEKRIQDMFKDIQNQLRNFQT